MKITTEIKTLLIGGVLLTLDCLVLKDDEILKTNDGSVDEKGVEKVDELEK